MSKPSRDRGRRRAKPPANAGKAAPSKADLAAENANLRRALERAVARGKRQAGQLDHETRRTAGLEAALDEARAHERAASKILRVISGSLTDVQPVFDAIAQHAWRLCDAEVSGVLPFDGELVHIAALGNVSFDSPIARAYPMPPSHRGAPARAILTGQVVHIPDGFEDAEYQLSAQAAASGFRGVLAVPMLREGRVIGSIVVGRSRPGAYSERHIELLKTFADQAVIAIENVRLFKDLQARNADLTEALEQQTATGEILKVISQSPTDTQPVSDTIVRSATLLCGATSGTAARFDGELMHIVASFGWTPDREALRGLLAGRPNSRTMAGRAVLARNVVQVEDALDDPDYSEELARAGGLRSMLAVPMLREGRPIGAIVVNRGQPGRFSRTHVELLKTFADQAVIAIENVRLFKELEARNADLSVALEQQVATSEILRVISSSPTDVQPVFDAIVRSAVILCGPSSSTSCAACRAAATSRSWSSRRKTSRRPTTSGSTGRCSASSRRARTRARPCSPSSASWSRPSPQRRA